MPKLQEFDAGNVAVRPTETGVEATALTARRVGTFASQYASAEEQLARSTEKLGTETESLGAMKGTLIAGTGARIGSALDAVGTAGEKIAAHMEVSAGSKAFTARLQDITAQWNDTAKNADASDPTTAARFMAETVTPAMDEFKSGFSTETAQAWAEAHANAFQQHMANKTSADMSTMAGQAVRDNIRQTANSLSATVYADPSSLDFALGTLKSTTAGVTGTSPNLSAADAGAISTEITQRNGEALVKAAAMGYIAKAGQVPPWLSDPKYSGYVSGAEMQMFGKQALAEQRREELTAKQAIITGKQIADLNAHTAANKNFSDNVSFDTATGRPVIKPEFFQGALDIARNNPNAPAAATIAKTYMDWGQAQQREHRENIVTDPATGQGIMRSLFDPAKSIEDIRIDILRGAAEHKISPHDEQAYRGLADVLEQKPLKGPIYQTAMKAAEEQLGVGLLFDGHTRMNSFVQAFIPQYLQAQRSPGGAPPNALDTQDENSMIRQAMKQFRPTDAQLFAAHTQKNMQQFFPEGFGAPTVPRGTAAPAPPRLTSKDDFDKLPSGAIYIGLDGKSYRKP